MMGGSHPKKPSDGLGRRLAFFGIFESWCVDDLVVGTKDLESNECDQGESDEGDDGDSDLLDIG